jgi:transposase-like protein
MNPQPLFCLNLDCPSRGKLNEGNIRVHNSLENRFRCHICGVTFASNKGTLFYRLKTEPETVIRVLTLLAHGCPLTAIVFAFGLDRRTIENWQKKAGEHCKEVHQHLVVLQPRDLGQVQADEIRAKLQKRLVLWIAMAIQVSTRLWLGAVVSTSRDKSLIHRLAQRVRCQASERPLLLMSDGLVTYVKAWKRAFCKSEPTGKPGRPRCVLWSELVIGQVVKCYEKRRVVGVEQRLVHGSWQAFERLKVSGQVMNTAYIERLNATFRQRLGGLVRRGRCLLRQEASLERGVYLVGCVYNFCTPHQSLCFRPAPGVPLLERTPAMAAGITDTIWSLSDLFCFRVAPPPYIAPKPKPKRGRPKGSKNKSKGVEEAAQ